MNFSMENLGPPKNLPKTFFMFGLFLYFEGKGGPKHKEFAGSRVPWRGGVPRGGFPAKFFLIHAFFRA